MEKKKELYNKFLQKGVNSKNLEKFIEAKFDHTVITPGTEFMDRLSKALKVKIQKYILRSKIKFFIVQTILNSNFNIKLNYRIFLKKKLSILMSDLYFCKLKI